MATLLRALNERFTTFDAEQRDRSRIDAPNFDPFIYVQPDEPRLSWILGDLLDPRGTHAQGELFLSHFLAAVGLHGLQGLARAQVVLECVTEALGCARRMDILIHGEDWVICIENKPWAADQVQQVTDYLEEMRRRGTSRFHLLYLTCDGSQPSIGSIAKDECEAAIQSRRLLTVSYATVSDWLEVCAHECQAERVNWFLKAFRTYIEQSLVGRRSRTVESIVMDTVFDPSSPEYLRSALELIHSQDAIRRKLKTRLMSAVESRLPQGWSVHRNLATEGALGLKTPRSAGWHFCVEPQRKGNRDWCYGIKYDDDVTPSRHRSIESLGKELRTMVPGSGQESEWWPYWRYFRGLGEHEPKEYADWEVNVQPWLDMDNGRMADHFVSLAERLYAALPMDGASSIQSSR
jgi:hypothetical protein